MRLVTGFAWLVYLALVRPQKARAAYAYLSGLSPRAAALWATATLYGGAACLGLGVGVAVCGAYHANALWLATVVTLWLAGCAGLGAYSAVVEGGVE
jgi:hypothetical protein